MHKNERKKLLNISIPNLRIAVGIDREGKRGVVASNIEATMI